MMLGGIGFAGCFMLCSSSTDIVAWSDMATGRCAKVFRSAIEEEGVEIGRCESKR